LSLNPKTENRESGTKNPAHLATQIMRQGLLATRCQFWDIMKYNIN